MPGQAQGLVAHCVDNRTMVLVAGYDERNGDACVDEGIRLESRKTSVGLRHGLLARARR